MDRGREVPDSQRLAYAGALVRYGLYVVLGVGWWGGGVEWFPRSYSLLWGELMRSRPQLWHRPLARQLEYFLRHSACVLRWQEPRWPPKRPYQLRSRNEPYFFGNERWRCLPQPCF